VEEDRFIGFVAAVRAVVLGFGDFRWSLGGRLALWFGFWIARSSRERYRVVQTVEAVGRFGSHVFPYTHLLDKERVQEETLLTYHIQEKKNFNVPIDIFTYPSRVLSAIKVRELP
jgi:hypothetical protein